jgi:hypothetical protein
VIYNMVVPKMAWIRSTSKPQKLYSDLARSLVAPLLVERLGGSLYLHDL